MPKYYSFTEFEETGEVRHIFSQEEALKIITLLYFEDEISEKYREQYVKRYGRDPATDFEDAASDEEIEDFIVRCFTAYGIENIDILEISNPDEVKLIMNFETGELVPDMI